MDWNYVSDVVVVGGGGAGLAAAVEASANAPTLLVEKNAQPGGTTGLAVGSYTASCTRLQQSAGISDSPADHDEDIGKFAVHLEQFNNPELRRFFAGRAADTLHWLMGMGLEFYGPSPEPPNRVPRMHNVVPNAKAYIAVLQKRFLDHGGELVGSLRATELVKDRTGRVIGVCAERADDGTTVRIGARRAVILTCGDFANAPDLKRQYIGELEATIEGINPTATGDGHRIGLGAGAAVANMQVVYGPEIRFIAPPREPFTQLLPANRVLMKVMGKMLGITPRFVINSFIKRLLVTWQHPETAMFDHGAILVNTRGQRFVDETAEPERAIPGQPDRIAYIVMDQVLAEKFSAWPHFISTAPDIAYAYIQDYRKRRKDVYHQARTVAELGAKIGVPPAELQQTVDAYNQSVDGATTDPFGRTDLGPGLKRGPFYALGPAKSWIVTTEGGLRVNTDLQVLDDAARVIPGLYAGGCNGLGGMVIWGHGLHIAWAFTSGRLAAQHAVQQEPAF